MIKYILALLALSISAFGNVVPDDRLGYSTHFDQGQSTTTFMPDVVNSGAAWIRDDTSWANCEHGTAPGQYSLYATKLAWMEAAHAKGINIIGDFQAGGPNATARYYSPSGTTNGVLWYPNPYDVQGYAKAAAWFASQKSKDGTYLVKVMEILNEPFAGFQAYEIHIGRGAYWLQDYKTLANAAYAAIKAANPSMIVIGAGLQGDWIKQEIQMGITLDGFVAHTYDLGGDTTNSLCNVPETTYEWQYRTVKAFMTAYRSWTKKPLWTTEQNISNGDQFAEAVWISRRMLLADGLGIEHTFFYTLCDNQNGPQGIVLTTGVPKQAYYVLSRLSQVLVGKQTIGSVVTTTPQGSNWDAADFYGYVFNTKGLKPVTAGLWFGNHNTTTTRPAPSVATVSFPGTSSHTPNQTTILDVVAGTTVTVLEAGVSNPTNAPQWTLNGTIANVTVSDTPITITVN